MLVKVPVLEENTRKLINSHLDRLFKHSEGTDLDSVVSEVLADRDIFAFLAAFLPKNHGLILGAMSFYDDITVYIDYGLTIDFDNLPRKTTLFSYKRFGGESQEDLSLGFSRIPDYENRYHFSGRPSPEEFAREVNNVLKDSKQYLVEFIKKKP